MKKPSAQSGGLFIVRINSAHNTPRAYTRGFYINPAHPIRLTPYGAPLQNSPGFIPGEFHKNYAIY